jgi:hypothetical protein
MDCGSGSEAWFDLTPLSSSLTLTGNLDPSYELDVTMGLKIDEERCEIGQIHRGLNQNLTLLN